MSRKSISTNEVSVDEQTYEHAETDDAVQSLRPTVDQQVQAKVDANHPDARPEGLTLEAEERMRARETEIARTRERAESDPDTTRERGSRWLASERSRKDRREFERRAASVDKWLDPDRDDPRAKLTQAQLGEVNEQARRLATELTGWSRAAVSRRLARRVVTGTDITSAVVKVFEELQTAPGTVLPIGKLEDVDRNEVSISGRVTTLWDPSHPSIAQVGLVADDSGRTRVTIWEKSDAPWVTEGEHVRIRGAARNWYEGRVSLAVTGSTTIEFPERGRWEE
jgi:hypothetical protein